MNAKWTRCLVVAASVVGLVVASVAFLNRTAAVAPAPKPPTKIVSAEPPWPEAELCLSWLIQKNSDHHFIKALKWGSNEKERMADGTPRWGKSNVAPFEIHHWCQVTVYILRFTDDTETKSVIQKAIFQVSFDGIVLGVEFKENDIN